MSVAQSHTRAVHLLPTADADLLTRLRIALATHRRAGWHLVSFTAQNGVVQLAGIVPTFYDRQLIAAFVRHVAGVFGIHDNLTVGEPSLRQQVVDSETIPFTGLAKSRNAATPSPFQHLPVLTQTLDDIAAGAPGAVLHTT